MSVCDIILKMLYEFMISITMFEKRNSPTLFPIIEVNTIKMKLMNLIIRTILFI